MPTTFNTTDPKPGYVYDTATDTWFPLLGIAPGSSVVRWRKTAVGAETSVSGLDDLSATLSYNAGTEQVYLNGVLLVRTEDYLATTGTSITGLTALAASDVIEVISFNATNVQITDALLETDINAKGDLIVGAAVDTAAILTSGTNGQVLSVNTATATGLEWVTSDDANAIQNAIVDAKGDIIAATAADTVARLAVGANGTVLTAASGQATGLEWATPSSGGFTLISTASPSAASTFEFTSIPNTYKRLYLVGSLVPSADGNGQNYFEFNSDTSSLYRATPFGSAGGATVDLQAPNPEMQLHNNMDNVKGFSITQYYHNYTQSNAKIVTSHIVGWQYDAPTKGNTTYQNTNFMYFGTSAISNIKFYAVTGTYTGTVLLYGQN